MAKGKRKISPAQRDKVAIETAKILKKKGIISKQAKLHGGKYVSRSVLKKVQEFQHLTKPSWTAIAVPNWYAKQAKEEGYQVTRVNNQYKVVVPKDHDFIKRAKKDIAEHKGPSGVKPVKGGFMSEVQVRFEGESVADLIKSLEEAELEGLKLPNEHFAYRLSGNEGSPHGMSYGSFPSIRQAIERLQFYSADVDATGFKLYRLHPEDRQKFIYTRDERAKLRAAEKSAARKARKGSNEKPHGYAASKHKRRMERMKATQPQRYERMMEEKAAKARKRYAEKEKGNPEYMEAARKRALASYHRNKGKK